MRYGLVEEERYPQGLEQLEMALEGIGGWEVHGSLGAAAAKRVTRRYVGGGPSCGRTSFCSYDYTTFVGGRLPFFYCCGNTFNSRFRFGIQSIFHAALPLPTLFRS